MNVTAIEDTVRTFVDEQILQHGATGLENSSPLLSTGVLNSLSLARVVSFLEGRFDVEIPMAEVVGRRFATVSAIANLVVELKPTLPTVDTLVDGARG